MLSGSFRHPLIAESADHIAMCLQGLDNPFEAARYHSLVIDKDSCPDDLEVTAWTEDGIIMGVQHKQHAHIQVSVMYRLRHASSAILMPVLLEMLYLELHSKSWCLALTMLFAVQGVQFHPESVITYQGKTIVQNFIEALDQ